MSRCRIDSKKYQYLTQEGVMIEENKYVKRLEAAWDKLDWERKFEYSTPRCDTVYVFHAYSLEEVEQAEKILPTLEETEDGENDSMICRSAHLGSYSCGETIVICEEIISADSI